MMAELRLVLALSLLAAVMVWDLRWRLIPDWTGGGLALLYVVPTLVSAQWGVLGAHGLVAAGAFLGAMTLFRLGWMGGGDVKLVGAVALWAGPTGIVQFLLLTSLVGGVVSLCCLAWAGLGRWRGVPASGPIQVPYGVAIALGAVPVLVAATA